MSFPEIVAAIRARAANATSKVYPGMRVAGKTTPCIVYNVDLAATMYLPGSFGKAHWNGTMIATCIADTLDQAADLAHELAKAFANGPHTHTGCKLVAHEMSFSTGTELPDDGQQDAERTVTVTINLQAQET
jgi:hypothetical protein